MGFDLKRPEVYYGQLTDSYVFVHTAQKEFDYPSGDSDVYTSYAGTGGVPVGSFWRRALYAWEFGSAKILFSSDITTGARIMYHRNIMDRATTALPFLQFDPEPYIVITDAGGLEWVLDGYTTSDAYPYSEPVGAINYMRNSVKVTINAYNGAITAYAMDPNDPVLRTYEAIFPGIFKPLTDMPADIRRHLRYPGRLFRIQASLEATYHMDSPDAFYHREDQWQIPAPSDEGGNAVDNLAAWMVARMDGAHYGQLMVYQFPKQSLVYGPRQIVNRINQDTDISRQITLWDQRGSQVIRGELLVIPIEESLIYVQPLFLRASGGSIPELKRVVVASGNRVVMGETLDQALNAMFGSGAAVPVSEAADTLGAALPGVTPQVAAGA
ncbi:MAG: membrane protein, partial [Gemmatimonadetes bacterium 21-71-4]